MLEQAIVFHQNGQMHDAEKSYSSILAEDPNNLGAMSGLGLLYVQSDRIEEGRKILLSALEIDPSNPYLLTNLGLSFF